MRSRSEEVIKKIVAFADEYREANGSSPSTREIGAALGIDHSTVVRYLALMEEREIIDRDSDCRIVTEKRRKEVTDTSLIPLYTDVACGVPRLVEERIDSYVSLPRVLLGAAQEHFLLVANGDSMIEAGIHSGDYILFRRQETAERGQIVVALVDDDTATCKRYYPSEDGRTVELRPANSAMSPIVVDLSKQTLRIQGVARWVTHSLEHLGDEP